MSQKVKYKVFWISEAFLKLVFILFSGKTTLADALVASNGIISNRLAGKVQLKAMAIDL